VKIEELNYGDLIEIEWIDADQGTGWTTLVDVLEEEPDLKCRSVGYFMFSTEKYIVAAVTIGVKDPQDVNGVWHIPRCWFQSCRKL